MNVITVPITEVRPSELEILVNAKGRKAAQRAINNVLQFDTIDKLCQEWFANMKW